MKKFLIGGAAAMTLLTLGSHGANAIESAAQEIPDSYVPGLEVAFEGSVCLDDVPYIRFAVEPLDFTPNTPVSLEVELVDGDGNLVGIITLTESGSSFTKSASNVANSDWLSSEIKSGETFVVQDGLIAGQILFPGADVDSSGNPTRWPGFLATADGGFVPIPGEDALRNGLTVTFRVDGTVVIPVSGNSADTEGSGLIRPRAETTEVPVSVETQAAVVEYPGTAESCEPPEPTTSTTTSTVPCEEGGDCLPATGSESQNILQIAAIVLAGGLILFAVARRRSPAHAPPATG